MKETLLFFDSEGLRLKNRSFASSRSGCEKRSSDVLDFSSAVKCESQMFFGGIMFMTLFFRRKLCIQEKVA